MPDGASPKLGGHLRITGGDPFVVHPHGGAQHVQDWIGVEPQQPCKGRGPGLLCTPRLGPLLTFSSTGLRCFRLCLTEERG